MSENNEYKFDFDEAETLDRLKALSTVDYMLKEKGMLEAVADDGHQSSDLTASFSVARMRSALTEYGKSKGYNHILNLACEYDGKLFKAFYNSPSFKAYHGFGGFDEDVIDESQFEIPNQSQKTL